METGASYEYLCFVSMNTSNEPRIAWYLWVKEAVENVVFQENLFIGRERSEATGLEFKDGRHMRVALICDHCLKMGVFTVG